MTQTLLVFEPRYPHEAGYRASAPETSRAAAMRVQPGTLRAMVMGALNECGPMTADECADVIGQSILSTRPRLTELLRMGMIRDTGMRRENRSGRMAAVWEVMP